MNRLVWILLFLVFAAPSAAADLNAVELRGDVEALDVITLHGAYLESLLWVWAYDSGHAAPLQAIALRCNGAGRGSRANCRYPSAFFGCRTTSESWPDFYNPALVTTRYRCAPPARRDAGACVDLLARIRLMDHSAYGVVDLADGHVKPLQALSLDVLDVRYSTACTSKP